MPPTHFVDILHRQLQREQPNAGCARGAATVFIVGVAHAAGADIVARPVRGAAAAEYPGSTRHPGQRPGHDGEPGDHPARPEEPHHEAQRAKPVALQRIPLARLGLKLNADHGLGR